MKVNFTCIFKYFLLFALKNMDLKDPSHSKGVHDKKKKKKIIENNSYLL